MMRRRYSTPHDTLQGELRTYGELNKEREDEDLRLDRQEDIDDWLLGELDGETLEEKIQERKR